MFKKFVCSLWVFVYMLVSVFCLRFCLSSCLVFGVVLVLIIGRFGVTSHHHTYPSFCWVGGLCISCLSFGVSLPWPSYLHCRKTSAPLQF